MPLPRFLRVVHDLLPWGLRAGDLLDVAEDPQEEVYLVTRVMIPRAFLEHGLAAGTIVPEVHGGRLRLVEDVNAAPAGRLPPPGPTEPPAVIPRPRLHQSG